jgi:hypothetical protein
MTKKLPGRPPKTGVSRDARINIRVSLELLEKLRAAAAQHGERRTLSDEAEGRLTESFDRDDEVRVRFGGAGTSSFLEVAAHHIVALEAACGGLHWYENRFVHNQVKVLLNDMLDRFKPAGTNRPPKEIAQRYGSQTGNMGVNTALQALSKIEMAKNRDNKMPLLFARAALPLGRRLRGSPYEEWREALRQWEAQRKANFEAQHKSKDEPK